MLYPKHLRVSVNAARQRVNVIFTKSDERLAALVMHLFYGVA
jgi:hypothetical protein